MNENLNSESELNSEKEEDSIKNETEQEVIEEEEVIVPKKEKEHLNKENVPTEKDLEDKFKNLDKRFESSYFDVSNKEKIDKQVNANNINELLQDSIKNEKEIEQQINAKEIGNVFINAKQSKKFKDPTYIFDIDNTLIEYSKQINSEDIKKYSESLLQERILIISSLDSHLALSVGHCFASLSKFGQQVKLTFADTRGNKHNLQLFDLVEEDLKANKENNNVLIVINMSNEEANFFFNSLMRIEDQDNAQNIKKQLKIKNRFILCQLHKEYKWRKIEEKCQNQTFQFQHWKIETSQKNDNIEFDKITEKIEENNIYIYVLFVATYFPDLTISEFNIMIEFLVKDEQVIVFENSVMQESKTDKDPSQKEKFTSLTDIWKMDKDKILSECNLTIVSDENLSETVRFTSVYQTEQIIVFFKKKPFFLDKQFQKLFFTKDFLVQIPSATNALSEGLISFGRKMVVSNPINFGEKLLNQITQIIKSSEDEDFKYGAFLAGLVDEMLSVKVLEDIMQKYFEQLRVKEPQIFVYLIYEITSSKFDKLFWIGQLLKNSHYSDIHLFILLNIIVEEQKSFEILEKVYDWISTDKERTEYTTLEKYSILSLYNLIRSNSYSEESISKQFIFNIYFSEEELSEKNKSFQMLIHWLFHPKFEYVFFDIEFENYRNQRLEDLKELNPDFLNLYDQTIIESLIYEEFKIINKRNILNYRCNVIEAWFQDLNKLIEQKQTKTNEKEIAQELIEILIEKIVQFDKHTVRAMKEYWRNQKFIPREKKYGKEGLKATKDTKNRRKTINQLLKKIKSKK